MSIQLNSIHFTETLLTWYDENKRSMIWRDNPTPYNVWISEIMLQQTRIEAAKAYFVRFMNELPTIESLANVDEDVLLKLWEGLGYYNRARNLKKTASALVERYEGKLPADFDCLIELAGIGPYTAGAIASIAYGIKAPAVDGNVFRVTMRYCNCDEDIGKVSIRKKVEQALMGVMPDRPGDFNQAIMELGEVVCIPNGSPHCEVCPLKKTCQANICGTQELLPKKAEKKPRRIEQLTIIVYQYENTFGIVKRPERGLLAGLYEFPSLERRLSYQKFDEYIKEMGLQNYEIRKMGDAKHVFSHVEWHMKGYHVVLKKIEDVQKIQNNTFFVTKQSLEQEYTIPVAFQAYLVKILKTQNCKVDTDVYK